MRSSLFKEIYYYLYPDNIIFPFNDFESAEEFIKENLHFLHMINEETHGSTDKFTLEIYLYLEPKRFYKMPKDFNQNDEDNLFLFPLSKNLNNSLNCFSSSLLI